MFSRIRDTEKFKSNILNKCSTLFFLLWTFASFTNLNGQDANVQDYPAPVFMRSTASLEPSELLEHEKKRLDFSHDDIEKFHTELGNQSLYQFINKKLERCSDYKKTYSPLKENMEKSMNQNKAFLKLHDRSQSPYYYSFSLYRTEEYEVSLQCYERSILYFYRRSFKQKDDAVFAFSQTPPINSKTGNPWFFVSNEEYRSIFKTARTATKDKLDYFEALQSILNEIFHYYYGEKFEKIPKDYPAKSLLGRYVPPKVLEYDGFECFLSQSAQAAMQKNNHLLPLSKIFGRPVYHLGDVLDTKPLDKKGSCWGKVCVAQVPMKTTDVYLPYFAHISEPHPRAGVNRSFRVGHGQIGMAYPTFRKVAFSLLEEAEKQRINLKRVKSNKTIYTQKMALLIAKTLTYMHACIVSPLVTKYVNSPIDYSIFRAEGLYEMVKLPEDDLDVLVKDFPNVLKYFEKEYIREKKLKAKNDAAKPTQNERDIQGEDIIFPPNSEKTSNYPYTLEYSKKYFYN